MTNSIEYHQANYGALTAQMFQWRKALEPYENKGLPMEEWQEHRDRIAKEYMKVMLDILIEGV